MPETIDVIPGGDLLISLTIPTKNETNDGDKTPSSTAGVGSSAVEDNQEADRAETPRGQRLDEVNQDQNQDQNHLEPTPGSLAAGDDQEQDHTETTTDQSLESSAEVSDPTPQQQPAARFRVSSKHLTVACPRFDRMLSGDWMEAKQTYPDGCRHVDLEADFDPEALRILLTILHNKTRSVPRALGIEMLTNMAVLVDDFGCHEAVQIWADLWIQKLENSIPTEMTGPGQYLMNWILISVVFGKPSVFQKVTRVAILYEPNPMNTSGLPIPASVDESVNLVRAESIQQLLGGLYDLIDELNGKDCLYTFEHKCMLLGALLRQMAVLHIPWVRPDAPFSGWSFTHIADRITEFSTPACCCNEMIPHCTAPEVARKKKKHRKESTDMWGYKADPTLSLTLHDILTPEIERLKNSIKGLNLREHSLGVFKDGENGDKEIYPSELESSSLIEPSQGLS